MAAPHNRHRSSLEEVIEFSSTETALSPAQRAQLTRTFEDIIIEFEPQQSRTPFLQVTLLRTMHTFAMSETSRDHYLRFFFAFLEIPIDDGDVAVVIQNIDRAHLLLSLKSMADYLVEQFFLPMKASTRKTPQPSPARLSEVLDTPMIAGTTQRVAHLRRNCLIRDRYRCVISRKFDIIQMRNRVAAVGVEEAKDDDGNYLKDEAGTFTGLEVAHIIPHSLTALDGQESLSESKKTALGILNMFDHGVLNMIDGPEIDSPKNAMSMTRDFHEWFGNFKVFFQPSTTTEHTYYIDTTVSVIERSPILPISRSLFLSPTRTIDPPSPRLLAIHRAIAQILHLSAAGEYIDSFLDDLDNNGIQADGSTELGRLVNLRLGGWWDGSIRAF